MFTSIIFNDNNTIIQIHILLHTLSNLYTRRGLNIYKLDYSCLDDNVVCFVVSFFFIPLCIVKSTYIVVVFINLVVVYTHNIDISPTLLTIEWAIHKIITCLLIKADLFSSLYTLNFCLQYINLHINPDKQW